MTIAIAHGVSKRNYPHPLSKNARKAWDSLEVEIKDLRARGLQVEVPDDWGDDLLVPNPVKRFTYVALSDGEGEVYLIAEVQPFGQSSARYITKSGSGWVVDETDEMIRRYHDSTDPWIPVEQARVLIESWGFSI